MKLLFCENCYDVFNLQMELKTCTCGLSKGMYIDKINAWYSGPCIPLGFANQSFVGALDKQPEQEDGRHFVAFVIPKECDSFKRKIDI